jgi:urate oxidase
MQTTIRYGKGQVTFYRTYAQPLIGLRRVPESSFTGRANIVFALDVDVEVLDSNFLPAYTEGDNSNVVATDTMKNFVMATALSYTGATLEGFLRYLGECFLATYPQMGSLRLTGRQQPFDAAPVPVGDGGGRFAESEVLFSRRHDEHAISRLHVVRDGSAARITEHRCGMVGLQLIKVTGSSFTRFVRDAHTTLPEQVDRPLFIYLDAYWRYADAAHAVANNLADYIAAEQVRDVVQVVFHRFNSKSIQHLIYEMGIRLLRRFPQLASVSFDAQNRLWETAKVSEVDEKIKVYCDPRPPYGMIHLTLGRDEAQQATETGNEGA